MNDGYVKTGDVAYILRKDGTREPVRVTARTAGGYTLEIHMEHGEWVERWVDDSGKTTRVRVQP